MTSPLALLDQDDFLTVVRNTPLVAIDLIVLDPTRHMLVGLRTNPPAQGSWFAPGGRIRKNETLDDAFRRITVAELGSALERTDAPLAGVYEHFYAEDFTGGDAGTHYVVIAHVLRVDPASLSLPREQHSGYRWVSKESGLEDESIHQNTRAYLRDGHADVGSAVSR